MDLWIKPEIAGRQNLGELEKPLALRGAQIIFHGDGRKPEVRINSEVKAIGKVKLKKGIQKKANEPIYENEVEGLDNIYLSKSDDPDCAHATLIRISDSWTIAFDFRYNKALSRKHIERARQFFTTAEFSFNQKMLAPCIDNLLSAAELAVKSILLSIPDPKFYEKAKHGEIKKRFNRFADLGNIEANQRETYNRLFELRYPARYLRGELQLDNREAKELLDNVKRIIKGANRRTKISK